MNLTKTLHVNSTAIAKDLSDQYAPVSTDIVLAPFFNKGWKTKSHIRPRKNKEGNRIGKEHITLVHPDFLYSNGDHLTIDCLNSNDGKSSLMLYGGYGRVVCTNGLIIGEFEGGRFVHRGESIYKRLEDQYDTIVAKLTSMREDITLLQSVTLTEEQAFKAVRGIVSEVFNKDTKKYKSSATLDDRGVRRLLQVRREEDRSLDAFTVLNVVQENIVRKGLLFNVLVTTTDKGTEFTTRDYKGKANSEGKIASLQMNNTITSNFLDVVREVA